MINAGTMVTIHANILEILVLHFHNAWNIISDPATRINMNRYPLKFSYLLKSLKIGSLSSQFLK